MNICLENSFKQAKEISGDTDDQRVLNAVYNGLTGSVALVGTHEDLKELVRQRAVLLQMIEEGMGHELTTTS